MHAAQKITDQELVKRYLKGSETSFEILLKRHKNRVFTYILLLVKDRDLAQDLFQDTFVRAIDTIKGGKYKEEGKFLPWIMRIAHNLVIDHFRKDNKMPKVRETEEFSVLSTISTKDRNVEENLVREQIHTDLRKLVKLLPYDQREVLLMRHYGKMSFKEIADLTGVSINTALGRMRYALINLKRMIEENEMTMMVA